MNSPASPNQPSLPWRVGSSIVMGVAGALSRIFMHGASYTEVHGLDNFLQLLDSREDIEGRQRGLITGKLCCWLLKASAIYSLCGVSLKPFECVRTCQQRLVEVNDLRLHCLYSLDDPMIWGVLPFRYGFNPSNHRWSLGSYDICFTNK